MSIVVKTDYKNVLIFAHDDMDGIIASFIIKKSLDNNLMNEAWDRNVDVQLCSYPSDLSFFKNRINEFVNNLEEKKNIVIYMLDYSLTGVGEMEKLNNWIKSLGYEFIWIDHHESAIQSVAMGTIDGLQNIYGSGTLLTWRYINKDEEIPKFVKMVSDFDTWNQNSEFSFEKELIPLCLFIGSLGNAINDNTSSLITNLTRLIDGDEEFLTKFALLIGKSISNYNKNEYEKRKDRIYRGSLLGYDCLIVNSSIPGSFEFDPIENKDEVDMLVKWAYDGNIYRYLIYGINPQLNVGDFCQEFLNGGGHVHTGGGWSRDLLVK